MKKSIMVKFRVTNKEYQMLKILASMYSDGDMSKWIRHSIFEAPREIIKKAPTKDEG